MKFYGISMFMFTSQKQDTQTKYLADRNLKPHLSFLPSSNSNIFLEPLTSTGSDYYTLNSPILNNMAKVGPSKNESRCCLVIHQSSLFTAFVFSTTVLSLYYPFSGLSQTYLFLFEFFKVQFKSQYFHEASPSHF